MNYRNVPSGDLDKIGREEAMQSCNRLVKLGRRQFLRGGATTAAATVAAGMAPRRGDATPALARITYPSSKLANIKDLQIDHPVQIHYPDKDSPGVIIKLGTKVDGGVGPDGDIVAFSTLCPHKGFPLGYVAADKTLNCPGHYSRFDCEKGGQQIWGHATQNLPQFRLSVAANGDIVAEGVDELIYGRLSNTLTA
jgi:arsenite oxidase small subunit